MKVKLSVGEVPYSGYLNIDPYPILEQGKEHNIIPGDIKNIDNHVENAQATEILADKVLNYVNHSEMVPVLQHYVSKLRHNGKLIVGGTDATEAAKSYLSGRLDTVAFNDLVFGSSQNAWGQKSGLMTLIELAQILEDLGLNITKKRIDETSMFVKGVRQ